MICSRGTIGGSIFQKYSWNLGTIGGSIFHKYTRNLRTIGRSIFHKCNRNLGTIGGSIIHKYTRNLGTIGGSIFQWWTQQQEILSRPLACFSSVRIPCGTLHFSLFLRYIWFCFLGNNCYLVHTCICCRLLCVFAASDRYWLFSSNHMTWSFVLVYIFLFIFFDYKNN